MTIVIKMLTRTELELRLETALDELRQAEAKIKQLEEQVNET